MATDIQGIIFDCFGVLVTDGWLPFKQKYFGHNPALMEQATDLNKQHDQGFLGHEEFYEQIAGLAGVPTSKVTASLHDNVSDPRLFRYITETLKPRYKIGLLSNTSGNYIHRLFTEEQAQLFDALALSYELGVVKPEPAAYEAAASLLQLEPAACVMIDDQERHCTGARDAGMQAVQYKDFVQFKGELERLLVR